MTGETLEVRSYKWKAKMVAMAAMAAMEAMAIIAAMGDGRGSDRVMIMMTCLGNSGMNVSIGGRAASPGSPKLHSQHDICCLLPQRAALKRQPD